MSSLSFCRSMLVIGAVLGGAALSSLMAGSQPATPTLEGGPISATGTRNETGNPINGTSGGLQTSGGASGQSAPSNTSAGGSVPGGGNYYGGGGINNSGANSTTSGVSDRGVAGSGLPREKVSVVDTKTLSTGKSDGKFSGSLMDIGLKSSSANAPTTPRDNQATGQKDGARFQARETTTASGSAESKQNKTRSSATDKP